ncbi:MAG TPA: hypothetical protein VFX86_00290 [Candidatus Saccharimonadales bacterium]|nr:hypothetical protein [Candidatus Saccharimonadales bacterium]
MSSRNISSSSLRRSRSQGRIIEASHLFIERREAARTLEQRRRKFGGSPASRTAAEIGGRVINAAHRFDRPDADGTDSTATDDPDRLSHDAMDVIDRSDSIDYDGREDAGSDKDGPDSA